MVCPCSNYKLGFLKLARYTSEIIIFFFFAWNLQTGRDELYYLVCYEIFLQM